MVMSEIAERAILNRLQSDAAPDTIFPFGQAENDWLPNASDD